MLAMKASPKQKAFPKNGPPNAQSGIDKLLVDHNDPVAIASEAMDSWPLIASKGTRFGRIMLRN